MNDLAPVSLVEINTITAHANILSNFVPNFEIAKGYFPPSQAEKWIFLLFV